MRLSQLVQKILGHDERSSALQGLRTDIQELIRAVHDQEAAYRKQNDNAQSFESNLPERIIRAEREINKYTERENRSYQKLGLWIQLILVVGTWFAFLAATFYAGIAAYQVKVMSSTLTQYEQQTTLMRQQIVGTQQAIVGIEIGGVTENGLQVIPISEGQILPKDIHADFEVTRKTFPGGKLLDTDVFALDWPLLKKGFTSPSLTDQWTRHSFKNFNESDKNGLNTGKQVVFVDVHFRYNNGFDDIIRDQYCTVFRLTTNHKGGIESASHPCGEFPMWLKTYKQQNQSK
jgi:hypothetical protein